MLDKETKLNKLSHNSDLTEKNGINLFGTDPKSANIPSRKEI